MYYYNIDNTRLKIKQIVDIAKKAGDVILKYYKCYEKLPVAKKYDNTSLTKADLESNNLIIKELESLYLGIPIVSEENDEKRNLLASQNDQYFIVDPLDGTDSFIRGSDEFTVNIALIKNSEPVFGVIFVPAKDIMYFTDENNNACKINNYSLKQDNIEYIKHTVNENNLVVILTKRKSEQSKIMQDLEKRNLLVKKTMFVSSSYKFCLIAEGKADLYMRRVNIKAWDIAAGHAIVNAAQGCVLDMNKNKINYKFKTNFDVPFFDAS